MGESDNKPDAEQIAAVREAEVIIRAHQKVKKLNLALSNQTPAPLEEAHSALVKEAEKILFGNKKDESTSSNPPKPISRLDVQQESLALGYLDRAKPLLDTNGITAIVTLLIERGIKRSDAQKLIQKADTDFRKPSQKITVDQYFFDRANRLRDNLRESRKNVTNNDPETSAKRREDHKNTLADLKEVVHLEESWKRGTNLDQVMAYIDKKEKNCIHNNKGCYYQTNESR